MKATLPADVARCAADLAQTAVLDDLKQIDRDIDEVNKLLNNGSTPNGLREKAAKRAADLDRALKAAQAIARSLAGEIIALDIMLEAEQRVVESDEWPSISIELSSAEVALFSYARGKQ